MVVSLWFPPVLPRTTFQPRDINDRTRRQENSSMKDLFQYSLSASISHCVSLSQLLAPFLEKKCWAYILSKNLLLTTPLFRYFHTWRTFANEHQQMKPMVEDLLSDVVYSKNGADMKRHKTKIFTCFKGCVVELSESNNQLQESIHITWVQNQSKIHQSPCKVFQIAWGA